MFQVGISRQIITPRKFEEGISLAGVRRAEERRAFKKWDDLFLRVAWFRGKRDFVLVNGDLLFFPGDLCEKVREWSEQVMGVDGACILMNATHTHSSPHMGELKDGGSENPGYRRFLIESIQQGMEHALQDLREAHVFFSRTRSHLCMNRRRRVWSIRKKSGIRIQRIMANRPNPAGPVDDDLSVLRITRGPEDITFLLFLGCHPNLVNGPVITADFPGRIQPALEEMRGKAFRVFFIQGFGGNVRPNILAERASLSKNPKGWLTELVEGRPFERYAGEAEIRETGRRVAERVLAIPEEAYRKIDEDIHIMEQEVLLPLRNDLGHHCGRANTNSEAGTIPPVPMRIKRICLGSKISLVSMPGEVFCEYALDMRRMSLPEETLFAGCSDGMIGYLPTQKAIGEGGYECERAYRLFGLPAPFSGRIEEVILEGFRNLMRFSHDRKDEDVPGKN